MRLRDEVAIITGAGGGIGEAVALCFSREGAKVALVEAVPERLDKVAGLIRSLGGDCFALRADISQRTEVSRMVKEVKEKYGRIDVLVNVAGIYMLSPIENTLEEEWDKVMNVNLKGTFLCSQIAGKVMIGQKKGNIVNIASIAGEVPRVYLGAYSSSKAGVILLTRVMALEWAKYNIRVNAISPGIISTPAAINAFEDERALKARMRTVPLNRIGEPEDVAKAAVFLASEDASYISGCVLPVDGASSISMYQLMSQLITEYKKMS